MTVKVIGKNHIEGTSKKTGNFFSLNVVHCTHKQNGVEGSAVSTVMLDSVSYPLKDIQLDKLYNLDRDGYGRVIGFDLV